MNLAFLLRACTWFCRMGNKCWNLLNKILLLQSLGNLKLHSLLVSITRTFFITPKLYLISLYDYGNIQFYLKSPHNALTFQKWLKCKQPMKEHSISKNTQKTQDVNCNSLIFNCFVSFFNC